MFYKKQLTFWRKWNLFMVLGLTGLALAERFVGEYIAANKVFDYGLWVLGAGLLVGVLMNRRSNSA